MGLFDEIAEGIGQSIGIVCGVAIAPIAIALNVSATAVKEAVEAGCRTVDEIKDYLDID